MKRKNDKAKKILQVCVLKPSKSIVCNQNNNLDRIDSSFNTGHIQNNSNSSDRSMNHTVAATNPQNIEPYIVLFIAENSNLIKNKANLHHPMK